MIPFNFNDGGKWKVGGKDLVVRAILPYLGFRTSSLGYPPGERLHDPFAGVRFVTGEVGEGVGDCFVPPFGGTRNDG